jgi:hypothetical protein
VHAEAAAGSPTDLEVPAVDRDPLPHADEAVPCRDTRIGTRRTPPAVVDDVDLDGGTGR